MDEQVVAAGTARRLKASSSLVCRLVQAQRDPAKQRLRQWLSDIDDQSLLQFGLTPEDIAVLRDTPLQLAPVSGGIYEDERPFG